MGVAVAQIQGPMWVRYPHDDEHPCADDSECTAGLRCQEAAFDIATQFPCASDRDCPAKRVRFRDSTLQSAAHCAANVCIYRPEPGRWCERRRQLWDAPALSERRCTFNRECPSGMSCGVGGLGLPEADARKIRGRCVFLPIFVWSPGTEFWTPNTDPRWPDPPPPPKNLPATWDITVKPLPPAPHGYFWIRESQSPCWWGTCRVGMGCIHMSHQPRYPATTYVLQSASSSCLPDEGQFDQSLGVYDEVSADLR